jgi:hypothetical protein
MSEREIPRVCRLLRCKSAFSTEDADNSWKHGDSTTEAYWCLASMEPFGPDGSYCHPHACREGRSCYRPGDDAPIAAAPLPDSTRSAG